MKSFEFKSLQETLDDIKNTIDPSNLRCVHTIIVVQVDSQ